MCRDKDKNFTATCGYLHTEGQEQNISKVLVFGFRTRNKCKGKPHRVLSVLFELSAYRSEVAGIPSYSWNTSHSSPVHTEKEIMSRYARYIALALFPLPNVHYYHLFYCCATKSARYIYLG